MRRSRASAGASFIGLSTLIVCVLIPSPMLAAQEVDEAALVERLRETARQLLEEDELAVRVEDTEEDEHVVVVGVVRIPVPVDHALGQVQRIERFFAHNPFVSQVQSIDDVRSPHELSRLKLSEDQAELLSECEVGSCKFKLPRHALNELRRADWSESRSMTGQAGDLMAGFLAGCLSNYVAHGNGGLPIYHDKRAPLAAADDYEKLLSGAERLFEHDDALHRHVRSGLEPPSGGSSHFFWIVEDYYGLRPLITLNQAIVRSGEGPRPRWGRVVIKQIYASHYLQAALRSFELVSVPGSDGGELWLTLHGRFRFDTEIGGLSRGILERRLESVWAEQLRAVYAYLVRTHESSLAMKESG